MRNARPIGRGRRRTPQHEPTLGAGSYSGGNTGIYQCIAGGMIAKVATVERAVSETYELIETSGVGSVPERNPRSCPPPEKSGSRRIRGRRRT